MPKESHLCLSWCYSLSSHVLSSSLQLCDQFSVYRDDLQHLSVLRSLSLTLTSSKIHQLLSTKQSFYTHSHLYTSLCSGAYVHTHLQDPFRESEQDERCWGEISLVQRIKRPWGVGRPGSTMLLWKEVYQWSKTHTACHSRTLVMPDSAPPPEKPREIRLTDLCFHSRPRWRNLHFYMFMCEDPIGGLSPFTGHSHWSFFWDAWFWWSK